MFWQSLSLGAATRHPGEPLEITVNRADASMYEARRQRDAIDRRDHRRRADRALLARCGDDPLLVSSGGDA